MSLLCWRPKRVLAGLLCWVALSGEAAAQVPDEASRGAARALADAAADAYANGDYIRAHELLARAWSLVPAPTVALLDARALYRASRWLEAAAAYQRAIDAPRGPDAPPAFHRAADEAQAELRSLQSRTPRLKLRLHAPSREGSTATVLLDGRALPSSSLGTWIPLDPGKHSLRVRAGNELGPEHDVALREGDARTLEVRAPSSSSTHRTWAIVSFGVGGAGLISGVVTGSIALDARRDAELGCPNSRCEPDSDGARAVDRFRTYRALSTVGYAVGIVGAAAGGVLLLTAPEQSSWTISLAPRLDGVTLLGTL